jgi:hypothetical protein
MINNPIIPNPVFETLAPPWQLITLDAWTASVNQSIELLYTDPSAFNATVSATPQVIAPGVTADVVLSGVNFQTSDNPYSNVSGVFTAPASGIYRFECTLEAIWPVAPGFAQAWFSLNGALQTFPGSYTFFAAGATVNNGGANQNGSVTVSMNQNDTMRIKMTNSGANPVNLGLPGQTTFTWFSGSMVR